MIGIEGPGIKEATVLDAPCEWIKDYNPWEYVEGGWGELGKEFGRWKKSGYGVFFVNGPSR